MKIKTTSTDYIPADPSLKFPWVGRYEETGCIILFTGKIDNNTISGVVLHSGWSPLEVGYEDNWTISSKFKPYYGTITIEVKP